MHPLANASFQWWLGRLPRYNLGLAAAGLSAFAACLLIGWLLLSEDAHFEVTFFTTLMLGIGCLIMMGPANVCYFLGPVSESILRPDNVRQYLREYRRCYTLPYPDQGSLDSTLSLWSHWDPAGRDSPDVAKIHQDCKRMEEAIFPRTRPTHSRICRASASNPPSAVLPS